MQQSSQQKQDTKQRVALTSIFASGGLTIAKGVVGFSTGSLAVLSEAAHSLLDLAATIMTYFAVRVSGKPADEEHHYGHGKVESVTALAETALLFLLSGIVIWEAGAPPARRRASRGRGDDLGVRRDRGVDRDRFLPRPPALPGRDRDLERGAGSRRAAFRLRHVVVDRGADRARRGRARLPVGGFGRRRHRRGVHLRRRLAARAPHHRYADRHRADRRRGQGPRHRHAHCRRGGDRPGAGAARRRRAVRRPRHRRQPHAPARSRRRDQGSRGSRGARRDSARPTPPSTSCRARSTTRPSWSA